MNTKSKLSSCRLALLVLVLPLASCSLGNRGQGIEAYRSYDLPAKLPRHAGDVVVKVSLAAQRAYVMEGSEMLMVMPVSVGTAKTPTPQGEFRMLIKDKFHRANSHGIAHRGSNAKRSFVWKVPSGWSFTGTPMPYWCEFKSNYGFHTGWMKHQPCTHGCIRMHENLAPKFYRLVQVGTPVKIAHRQPEDRRYADIPLPPDAGPLPDYSWEMYLSDRYFSHHKSPEYRVKSL